MSAEQRVNGRSIAWVGDERDIDVGSALEHFECDARKPRGNTRQRQGTGLGTRRVAPFGEREVGRSTVDDDDYRRSRALANWLEAGERIVVQLSHMRRDKKCGRSAQQGAAVGCGAGYSFGSDDCARTRAVLGKYGDALSTTDLLAQNTSKDVSSAARWVWNDNLDSSRSLRPRTSQFEKDSESASARDQIERSTARKFHNDAR